MSFVAPETIAARPAPLRRDHPWWRALAGSPTNLVITLGFLAFAWFAVVPLLGWATWGATWTGTAETCAAGHGACWAFVAEKARFMAFGFYPPEHQGRAGAALAIMAGLLVASGLPRLWGRGLVGAWGLGLVVVIWLLGGGLGLQAVPTERWGGLPVTLLLSLVAFAVAFPLAVLLALARRSRMAGVRLLAVAFIEGVRGVPFITILYAATLLFPLMLPMGASIDKFARATAGLSLFVAAYLAEIVRAGLQAVPRGQWEAAASLGLPWWKSMRLVVLPQALRVVIPAIVNLAIGIVQDTTLVVIIGMYELLNAARAAATDPAWLGFFDEAYAAAALVYFVLCFSAARYSLWLEKHVTPRR